MRFMLCFLCWLLFKFCSVVRGMMDRKMTIDAGISFLSPIFLSYIFLS